MTDYTEAAAKYLDLPSTQILTAAVRGSDFSLVVDFGIGGAKKLLIPLSALQGGAATPEPIETEPEKTAVNYARLNVAQLKALAKERDIKITGLKKAELIAALEEA